MASPTVTVITATYNSACTLRFAISSILAQTFEDWEAWIVGDGCTDDSETVVRSFDDPRLHWWNLETNHKSQAFPNNEGLRRARGRYVAYLGHDDLWLPNHLALLVACLYACFGPPRRHHDYLGHHVPPSCWLHRRELVDEIGDWGDPAQLAAGVDTDYLSRICRAGKRTVCLERFTVIKVPSGRIGLYSLVGEPPQAKYWRRVETDSAAFLMDLLGTAAAEQARLLFTHPSLSSAMEQAARTALRELRRVTADWPVFFHLWRWWFRRLRQAGIERRGLPRTFLQ